MSATAQVLANRGNAQLSTGPKTEAGKATSSQNARKHGLSGSQIVIPGEDAAAYDALRESLEKEFNPKSSTERTLVEELAANSWRLARAHRVEAAFYRKLTENSSDPDMAIATAMIEKPAELARLQRYLTSIERAYYRAMSQLNKLQHARKEAEYEEVQRQVYIDLIRKNGFESHAEPAPAKPTRAQASPEVAPQQKAA